MKHLLASAFAASLTLFSSDALAGPDSEKMAHCFVNQTTGQDRIDLVQWIIVMFAKHPEAGSVIIQTAGADIETNERVAQLFEDLLFNRCLEETKRAYNSEGNEAVQTAFSAVGEIAAFELMQNKIVTAHIQDFAKLMDTSKFDTLKE